MMMSTPLATWLSACLAAPASAPTLMPCGVALLDDVDRRGAEGVGDEDGPVLQGHVEVGARDGVQPAEHAVPPLSLRQGRDAELEQRLVDELLVVLGDHRPEVERGALGGDLHRHHDVDAVGLAVGVVVEPGQDPLELLGVVEPDAAEDAEAAGARDRGGDVLGGGEGEDRVVDAELVAEVGAHQAGAPSRASRASSLARGYCALPVALRGISATRVRWRGSL